MIGNILYAIAFLLAIVVQTAGVTSLPLPLQLFPLALVLGIIILHERSLLLGTIWIALSGVVLQILGLGDGLAIASGAAALAAAGLALSIFAKRSFLALLGVSGGSALVYVTTRILWLGLVAVFTDRSIDINALLHQASLIVFQAVLGVFVFGAYIRRFARWSRDKFVSKAQLYDVSFPQ